MGSEYFLRTDFQFCKMKSVLERSAVVAAPQCECANAYEMQLKTVERADFMFVCILPQLKIAYHSL